MTDYLGGRHANCWEFVRFYYAGHGIELPEMAYLASKLFEDVATPQDGDLVLIDGGVHCGIYHAKTILHHENPLGVRRDAASTFNSVTYHRLR